MPPPPLSELRNYWSDLKIQTAFDIYGKFVEKPNVVDLEITDDVTGQVRVKMFDDLEYLVCRALEPYQMKISQYNDMYRVWDTSKYNPKVSVSIFKANVIQGNEVKERSK